MRVGGCWLIGRWQDSVLSRAGKERWIQSMELLVSYRLDARCNDGAIGDVEKLQRTMERERQSCGQLAGNWVPEN